MLVCFPVVEKFPIFFAILILNWGEAKRYFGDLELVVVDATMQCPGEKRRVPHRHFTAHIISPYDHGRNLFVASLAELSRRG